MGEGIPGFNPMGGPDDAEARRKQFQELHGETDADRDAAVAAIIAAEDAKAAKGAAAAAEAPARKEGPPPIPDAAM